jgi:hypothetical protein
MSLASGAKVGALTGGRVACLAVSLFYGGQACDRVVAEEPTDRTPVAAALADWQTRQKAMKTARYVLSGTGEFLKPLSPDSPPAPDGDSARPYRAAVLLDLEGKRFRSESSEVFPAAGGKYEERTGTIAYNGAELRQGQPRELAEANGGFDVLITKVTRDGASGSHVRDLFWPLLFAHGIVPTAHQPAYVERLPFSLDPEQFFARGRHTLRGGSCRVFRTQPELGIKGISDEYWVRPDRVSAIARYVYLTDGQPWARLDIEWADSSSGWMPRSWTHALTTDGKNVNRLYTLRVDRFEANPNVSDADFTIPVAPGMKRVVVAEEPPAGVRTQPGFPGRRTYRIDDDGEWVELSSEGWKDLDGSTIPLPSQWSWRFWTAASAIVVLVGGCAVFRRRRRRAALDLPP